VLIVPDNGKALDMMRHGDIDVIGGIPFKQAQQMKITNPEILQIAHPGSVATLDPRNDVNPLMISGSERQCRWR